MSGQTITNGCCDEKSLTNFKYSMSIWPMTGRKKKQQKNKEITPYNYIVIIDLILETEFSH